MKILVLKEGGEGYRNTIGVVHSITHMDRLVLVLWHPYFIGRGGIKLVHKNLKFRLCYIISKN